MIEIRRTPVFAEWLDELRDRRGAARIIVRIERMADGSMGVVRSVGDGVRELKIDFGPGYRVYFVERGNALIVLLCGGDKDSQVRDITRAKALAKEN